MRKIPAIAGTIIITSFLGVTLRGGVADIFLNLSLGQALELAAAA